MSLAREQVHMSNKKTTVIVGLGQTGYSCVQFLRAKGEIVRVLDSRENPPFLEQLKTEYPEVVVQLGPFKQNQLENAETVIVSPGISMQEPIVQIAESQNINIIGDIELFCQQVTAPIIAITGSNGKSTVTTLLGEMIKSAGIDVGVGGNIGTPALDMLAENEKSLYVLELSSFQLETTHSLQAEAATILNLSNDHMDRYVNMSAYKSAKQRIFNNAKSIVLNADEPSTHPLLAADIKPWFFSLQQSGERCFHLMQDQGEDYLAFQNQKLLARKELKLIGRHNVANALAALALGQVIQLPMSAMLTALKSFPGLPHRCQWVAKKNRIDYFNDSKATNVGSTIAALESFAEIHSVSEKNIILIAGGDAKGADLSVLEKPLRQWVKTIVLIGKDAKKIAQCIDDVEIYFAVDMQEAVTEAAKNALPGDTVLLSPACSSLDMYENFIERGFAFIEAVKNIPTENNS